MLAILDPVGSRLAERQENNPNGHRIGAQAGIVGVAT